MACHSLLKWLDSKDIEYSLNRHSRSYTSQETAARTHTKGNFFAKSVIVMIDGTPGMVVLPAAKMVNLAALRRAVGAERVFLATEEEFRTRFPDCEIGAMPPFGNLYDMDVFAAESLPRTGIIAFNSGTHSEIMQMEAADWERAVHPVRLKVALESQPTHTHQG